MDSMHEFCLITTTMKNSFSFRIEEDKKLQEGRKKNVPRGKRF